MFKHSILALVAVLFVSSNAMAGFVLNPSLFYFQEKERDGVNVGKETIQIINLKVGYVSPQGLYLGAAYDMESRKYGSGASDQDRDSYGATIGYVTGGWQFLGTYYINSEFEQLEGWGYAIDVGYSFNLGSIGIGPLLSYRHWEYDESNGSSLANKIKNTNILPSIQFYFTF